MTTQPTKSWLWPALGWAGVVLFLAIYSAEFLPRHGPPVTIRWLNETIGKGGLIAINVLIVLSFLALLPYRRPTKGQWKTKGTFAAFVIALMTEMFGWPLILFLLSPLVKVPIIAPKVFHLFGHVFATVGTAISIVGIALIAGGWAQIHRASGLVTTGLYRYIRHPQYTGLLLFTLGWLLHWPSIVTLLLWPILTAAYVWLAMREEREAINEFGSAYLEYAQRTKRFIPFVV